MMEQYLKKNSKELSKIYFGQSRKTTRSTPLAAAPPSGIQAAGFKWDPQQLLLCETEVYGLISGPSWLRQSLVADLEQLGYEKNHYDKCVMTLPSNSMIKSATTPGLRPPPPLAACFSFFWFILFSSFVYMRITNWDLVI